MGTLSTPSSPLRNWKLETRKKGATPTESPVEEWEPAIESQERWVPLAEAGHPRGSSAWLCFLWNGGPLRHRPGQRPLRSRRCRAIHGPPCVGLWFLLPICPRGAVGLRGSAASVLALARGSWKAGSPPLSKQGLGEQGTAWLLGCCDRHAPLL